MSFNFNTATTTAGGMFKSPTTDTKPAFNFQSPGSTFSFGGAKTTAPTSSLFSTPATTNTAGSAFGAAKPAFGGFTSPPNQTVGSPGFGQPATQNAANLSFGGAQQQQQPAPAFGTPATQAAGTTAFGASPSGGGFSFGKPAGEATPTGFGFATPASGFGAPQPTAATTTATPQTTQAGFLGSTTGAGFGQSAFGAKPGSAFSFSSGTAQTPAFGATSTAAPTSSTGFALQQPQQQQQQQPTTTQTGLNFGGGTTGLGFAQPTASTPALGSGFQMPTATNFSSPTGAAAPGGIGGFGKPTTTAQPATGLPNFGATPASSAQPTTGLSFGTTPASSATLNFGTTSTAPTLGGATTSQPSTGLNFGTTTAPTALSFAKTSASIQPPSFGAATSAPTTGLSFGTTTTAQATTGLSFGTTAPTTGLSFGTSTTAPTTGLNFGTTATSAATTSSGFGFTGTSTATGLGFGIKPTTTLATSSAASTAAPSGITALGKTTTTMASLTTATTTTTAAAPPQIISNISFAQLEESINKWTLELEEQEKTFINQATQINAWDRLLISNGEKIVELNDAVQTVKNEQQSLEHELDFVLAQQKELEDLLTPMEKQMLDETTDRLKDPEREHLYTLAENLDTQLRQMSEDLKEVIEHLNETNRSQDSNDPIVQIGRILNAHMSSMQWIDNSIAQISTKLDQLKATHDTLRRDNERSFQLTYN
ncbi:uncharacterized protein LOC142983118 isoform X2 [Anticarsia gemmatalis]|uniref:uncharacterized protein LOC142983118 isoform X2 n=1 Tax=Anticarsia gemmatalis TaxID=129554 RepID=UPI003F77188A